MLFKVIDNSGILRGKAINVLGTTRSVDKVKIGDYIRMIVKGYRVNVGILRDKRKWKQFMKGSLVMALVIRIKRPVHRGLGITMFFSDNAVVLVNKKRMPLAKRLYGPVLVEFTKKNAMISSMSQDIV